MTSSATSSVPLNADSRNLSRPDGFVESTLRSLRATPLGGQQIEPEEFMKGLFNEVEKSVKFRILNPFLDDVRPELLKKSQAHVPTVKWSGQNDLSLIILFH